MRSIGTPTISCQIASASSSDSCTVTQMRSPSKPHPPDSVSPGDELPAPRDRRLLEVVAEAEVAEHLEEHQVPLGAPDVVEVVVLAAGAGALLRADRTLVRRLLVTDEVRLERHHAGDVEQHGRVVRDQARRGHGRVTLGGEEVTERIAEFVRAHRLHRAERRIGGRSGVRHIPHRAYRRARGWSSGGSAAERARTGPADVGSGHERRHCGHLDTIIVDGANSTGCEDCLAIGSHWLHLRRCTECGHVGCCDSSPNRHATAHFRRRVASDRAELRAGRGMVVVLRRRPRVRVRHRRAEPRPPVSEQEQAFPTLSRQMIASPGATAPSR